MDAALCCYVLQHLFTRILRPDSVLVVMTRDPGTRARERGSATEHISLLDHHYFGAQGARGKRGRQPRPTRSDNRYVTLMFA